MHEMNPVLVLKDKQIEEMTAMIKMMKEQFEIEKQKQREEYMRAFMKLREEMQSMKSSTKGHDDEINFF